MSRRRITRALSVAAVATTLAACDSGSLPDIVDAGATATPTAAATSPAEPAEPSAPAETPPSVAPTAAPGRMTIAVYYLVDTKRGIRLQREFRQVARSTTPVRTALETMFGDAPLDRDYRSVWPRTTKVRALSRAGTTLTVDLSREALDGRGGAEATAVSLQQLVYTVTAADNTVESVRLLVEGREVSDFWGHESLSGRSMRRRSHVDVLAAVSIDTPGEGAEVGQTFTISGTATVFEANVQWKITRGCPADVQCVGDKPTYRSGFVTSSEGAPGRGTWSVRVTLPDEVFDTAGFVEITAFEESAEDGSVFMQDTKVVHATR